jgi:hypothetical protein
VTNGYSFAADNRSSPVGILEYLLGPKDSEPDDVQPSPSTAGAGPNVDEGRITTKTEMNLRRVQSTHDPETDSFKGGSKR